MEGKKYKSRRVQKRNLSRYKVMGAIAIVMVVVLLGGFSLYRFLNRDLTTFSSNKSLPFYRTDAYTSNSTNLFYIRNNELKSLTKNTKEAFSSSIVHNGNVAASEKYVGVYDESGYQLFDMKGNEVSKKEGSVTIVSMRLSENYVAIEVEENGKDKIYVYDEKGNEKYQTEVDSSSLLDYGIHGSENVLWTLTSSLKSSQPTCTYAGYNFVKNSVTNVINITDQLAEKVLLSGEYIYVIGTNNFVTYTQLGKKEDSYLVYGWKLADYKFTAGKPTYVLVPRSDEGEYIKNVRIKHSDNSEYTFTLQDECFDVIISGENIYSFSQNNVYINDLKGNYLSKANLPFAFKEIIPVFQNTHIIVDDGSNFSLLSIK